ncbi:pentatricopeptide repeat-containing protein At1g62260, mitochondrial [Argentina anserina]|uniref:pentatricopeptide repeat-containing protein At1g62260, mitochondrial n=1 Tax=Argentina anserina TaxID=57926 RepID=UPI002176831C|nr:pentatricopeptide repeat-containing protein At1g62260, mitochondrial [Potentilla anserina]XP_050370299.1 pentatricopeptide repeat-containing protein At1g62260, mitochondrial [Potentilla anserina]XP_050370300.1 pentatricopeptide repeat-containing protein At1g62260, mitochondrial [Potentilla anserina]XP_050370301.1 pentatricopeptide repeat-containing protein At1g62260, mitochondrial [Potentilla anserina]XP_050370302.1 pentatricopeptide repeat-containing protein At1g62260, mitochondrial [Potent
MIVGNANGSLYKLIPQSRRLFRLITIPIPNHTSLHHSRFASISKPDTLTNSKDVDFFSSNKRISLLIRMGQIEQAREAFDEMKQRNIVTWNSMITGYVKRREMAKARKLFDEMLERDVVSWNLMISGYVSCRGSRYVEEGRSLFDQMPARDCVSWNTMISGYAKNGRMREALQLFDSMPEKSVVSWNAMVSGFLQNGNVARAVEFFERMPLRDGASVSALVSGLIQNGELDDAARVVGECRKRGEGVENLVNAYNTLVVGYGRSGRVEEARRLFDQIPLRREKGREECRGFERNIVSWNSMIMCYVKTGNIVSARELFDQMIERDTFSWNTMISGYVNMLDMEEAAKIFHRMPNPDGLSWNTMITGYAQVGSLELAQGFFERMPEKNLVSWNSMIAGYEKNEDFIGGVKVFSQMQLEGEKPDRHTLSSVLSVSTGLVDLHLGTQIHQLVTKTVIADLPINNSLITMYSRCGALKEAETIFDEMKQQKDVISWNAMIGGYASHGFAVEAFDLFSLMKRSKVQPTYITFIAVLNACAHAGLVEEGRSQFKSMISEFGIEPCIEHYASLVDIIGRHGQLEEASDLIKSMPFEPDKAVWGALLGACRVHNNVELAKVAAEALTRLEPKSSAPYVLLYNMYADAELWDEAAAVRSLMDENRITKHAAYSRVNRSHC